MRIGLLPLAMLLVPLAACASRGPGFVTPGMPAPNCDGYEHPEENPACPEWVAPWQRPMAATPAPTTSK
jgi:hypothetical protein